MIVRIFVSWNRWADTLERGLRHRARIKALLPILFFIINTVANFQPQIFVQGDNINENAYSSHWHEKLIRRDVMSRLKNNLAAGLPTSFSPTSKCDRLFLSTPNGIRNGTFESPSVTPETGYSLQCIFYFVPMKNERVDVQFTMFGVRGTPPECAHEWVDLYTEVEDTDVTDLISTPFGGRYCGKIPPRRRISLYGGIAIGFYTDKNATEEGLFRGTYGFSSEERYRVGTPQPRTLCSYTVYADKKKQGELVSPTYPGVYPKDLTCSYRFIGSMAQQRIRLEFRDFDLFYGGGHCPFDEVKIFDGNDTMAPLIGTYCGQQRNLVVYSSEQHLLILFKTLERNTETQNRGFSAVFEFSESFVKLDFIGKNTGMHIRGTECDQRILSRGNGTNGAVYSPNYPYPYLQKIVCRYFVYGLQDPQHLERVRLVFEKFDVPSTSSAEEEPNSAHVSATKCGDGSLKIYMKGQEVVQAYDKADHEFCGKDVPAALVSDGPRLVLVFSSGDVQGSGFKALYIFEPEYKVRDGTPAPDGSCHFTYYSTSQDKGEFNSPRFPENYPSNSDCIYDFVPRSNNEQVRIVFDHFKVKAEKFNFTFGAYGNDCQEDWVEISNVFQNNDEKLVGRYCGHSAPGPIESKEQVKSLKIHLHTDESGVFNGFRGRYMFFKAKSVFGECGQNFSSGVTGALTSPKWPGSYEGHKKGEGSSTCNWYLSVRHNFRVMLHFQIFVLEGDPLARGCSAAAVRIWEDPDGVPIELCGEKLEYSQSQYVSVRSVMRVTFITADKAVGARGFRAVWTEVADGAVSCQPNYFRCRYTHFCIPYELRCDGTQNCGIALEPDNSDEENCNGDLERGLDIVVIVAVSGGGALVMIAVLCVWGEKKKRRRRRRLNLRRPPIHVCDNAGARFAAMDSV